MRETHKHNHSPRAQNDPARGQFGSAEQHTHLRADVSSAGTPRCELPETFTGVVRWAHAPRGLQWLTWNGSGGLELSERSTMSVYGETSDFQLQLLFFRCHHIMRKNRNKRNPKCPHPITWPDFCRTDNVSGSEAPPSITLLWLSSFDRKDKWFQ